MTKNKKKEEITINGFVRNMEYLQIDKLAPHPTLSKTILNSRRIKVLNTSRSHQIYPWIKFLFSSMKILFRHILRNNI